MRMLSRASASFRNQLKTYQGDLYRVAYSWCHDRQTANDLVQETSLKALRHAHTLKNTAAMKSWLFRIMHNCWCDLCRKRHDFNEIQDHHLVTDKDAGDDIYRQQIAHRVRLAISQLNQDQRRVVTLVDLASLSYQEVADILEIPVGTVMSRLCRARRKLAEFLQDLDTHNSSNRNNVRRIK